MVYFHCDYAEGAHPRILARLAETNPEQTTGYGSDKHCEHAAEIIRTLCKAPEAQVFFLVGGTQVNLIALSAMMRSYQGAVCAHTGHINVHETGAIEACGHKVLALPSKDGLLDPDAVDAYCAEHFSADMPEHTVQPGVVYISQSTELGSIYSRAHLQRLREVCNKWHLYLYIDGARLGYALAAEGCDVDLPFLAQVCDGFTIGGTKQGALFGEALVLTRPELVRDFRYLIKQRGALLAKGRLLGIQFEELLKDGLYFELAKHADTQALRIREVLLRHQVPIEADSHTNQLYVTLPNEILNKLSDKYMFSFEHPVGDTHSFVRICTSWATKSENVDSLLADLEKAYA